MNVCMCVCASAREYQIHVRVVQPLLASNAVTAVSKQASYSPIASLAYKYVYIYTVIAP